jgi:hypothetical protein
MLIMMIAQDLLQILAYIEIWKDYLQKEKGFAPSQIIACGAGNLQGSSGFAPAFTETGVVEIGFPDTNNLDPNAPVQLPITRA